MIEFKNIYNSYVFKNINTNAVFTKTEMDNECMYLLTPLTSILHSIWQI